MDRKEIFEMLKKECKGIANNFDCECDILEDERYAIYASVEYKNATDNEIYGFIKSIENRLDRNKDIEKNCKLTYELNNEANEKWTRIFVIVEVK